MNAWMLWMRHPGSSTSEILNRPTPGSNRGQGLDVFSDRERCNGLGQAVGWVASESHVVLGADVSVSRHLHECGRKVRRGGYRARRGFVGLQPCATAVGDRVSHRGRTADVVVLRWSTHAGASILLSESLPVMSNEMKIAAATVRQLREARAWSQEQLAAVSGISPRTVQRVENEGVASLDTRMALAAALECTPETLLESTVADRMAHAQPAAVSASQMLTTRSSFSWLSLAWLVFVLVAFLAIVGYNVGQDLAERDNMSECKGDAAKHGTTCGIGAAEARGKSVKAE